ncbi:hypothetical protein FE257_007569 [Aspergillus nanangensis]|uniref:Enoyl reductase (ER) domain-containing protein n=1 Tax=Aspergillus nanangensis TaxID=2582783 RepID=A0AAD4GU31_ASPNN|nr:hypothetical protein FE257_007569 [Aspergillus nanangensis]
MPHPPNPTLVVRVQDQSPRLSKENLPIPSPAPNQVLVKLSHVAQNPTDIQAFDSNAFGDGAVLGCDFVGEVVERGSDATRLTQGDIVAGLVWGGEIKSLGGYSQYCVADDRISFKVPEGISRAQASTVPLASATAWLALFSKDCLNLDRTHANGTSVLVWGGSSSVGLYTIQLAARHGFSVVTTCSPKHADLVRSYGASHVFDYKDDQVVETIRRAVPTLTHVFDTIGSPTSSVTASYACRQGHGNLCTVRPGKAHTENVAVGTKVTDVLVWTAFLKDHSYAEFRWPASREDHELCTDLFENLPDWLAQDVIKPSTPKLLGGLDGVPQGFQEYRDGKISGYKITDRWPIMIEEFVAAMTPGRAVVYFLGAFFVVCLLRKMQVSMRIAQLGGRAPKVQFRLPYAIDFIYRSSKANKAHHDLVFFSNTMANAKGAAEVGNCKTAEVDAGVSARVVFTQDPENIKAILTGQFADYGKGESFHRDWREFLGDSIFVTDGELWSRSRHLIRPMFVRERLVDTEIFERHVQHLIPLLEGGKAPGGSKIVDVGPLFYRYTLDAATDYLLGKGTDSLQNPATAFAEAFRYVQHRQALMFRLGVFGFILSKKKFREQLKVMDDFLQPYIERVLSLSTAELDQKVSSRDTFLDALARFTRDPRILRDQLVAILLAGRDTTAATLAFCLFELSRNPGVVAKLREEILARGLGVGPTGKKPSYNDLKDMKFLNGVLHETMRLYPVVPFNVRFSLNDTTLPRGSGADGRSPVGVREGTRIIYSTMIMQRNPEFYPPPGSPNYFDSQKWLPERWVSGWQPKPWQFVPFNGGPRICIGQQFAMIEMGYTVVRILQAFEQIQGIPAPGKDKVEDPVMQFEVTLSPGSELNCVFVREGEGSKEKS